MLLLQIQTEISEGHINLIKVYDLILTPTHLGLVMEAAEGEDRHVVCWN